MGTWGVDLYENDDAQDILDAIREGGGIKGMSVIGLQQQLAYAQMPPSERGLFWCILADQMAKAGIRDAAVLNRAMQALDSGTLLADWAFASKEDREARTTALMCLRDRLTASNRSPKVRRGRAGGRASAPELLLIPGDVFSLKITEAGLYLENRFIAFRIAGIDQIAHDYYAVYLDVYRNHWAQEPSFEDILQCDAMLPVAYGMHGWLPRTCTQLRFSMLSDVEVLSTPQLCWIGRTDISAEPARETPIPGTENDIQSGWKAFPAVVSSRMQRWMELQDIRQMHLTRERLLSLVPEDPSFYDKICFDSRPQEGKQTFQPLQDGRWKSFWYLGGKPCHPYTYSDEEAMCTDLYVRFFRPLCALVT